MTFQRVSPTTIEACQSLHSAPWVEEQAHTSALQEHHWECVEGSERLQALRWLRPATTLLRRLSQLKERGTEQVSPWCEREREGDGQKEEVFLMFYAISFKVRERVLSRVRSGRGDLTLSDVVHSDIIPNIG